METAIRRSPVRNVLALVTGAPDDARVLAASSVLSDRYRVQSTVLEVPVQGRARGSESELPGPEWTGGPPGRLIQRNGDPVEAVLAVAEECRSDLVVAAEAGMLTQRLLRRSPCSLLIVPGEAPPGRGPILSLVDFSPASLRAARWACEQGRVEGVPVELLHVFPIPWQSGRETRPQAARAMEEFASGLDTRGAEVTTRVELASVGGYVTATILDEIRRGSYSQVFMGSRPRSNISAFLFGSVAERVVLAASLPVWIARPEAS